MPTASTEARPVQPAIFVHNRTVFFARDALVLSWNNKCTLGESTDDRAAVGPDDGTQGEPSMGELN